MLPWHDRLQRVRGKLVGLHVGHDPASLSYLKKLTLLWSVVRNHGSHRNGVELTVKMPPAPVSVRMVLGSADRSDSGVARPRVMSGICRPLGGALSIVHATGMGGRDLMGACTHQAPGR